MSRRFWLALCLPLLGWWAGCQAPGMGGIVLNAEISGGEKVRIPVSRKGAVKAENDDLAITGSTLLADFRTRRVNYGFSFQEKHPFGVRSVKVEDVTDDEPVTLIDDEHPLIDAQNRWRKVTRPFTPTPDSIPWLMEVDYNMRIYRFTIVKADGQTDVLYSGQDYGNPIKHFIRVGMGLEKPDR